MITQSQKSHIYEIQRAAGLCVDVFARANAVLLAENALRLAEKLTQKELDESGLGLGLDDLRAALSVLQAKQEDLLELVQACVKVRAAEINRL